jgi:heterodisulfide reductase subunit A
MINGPEPRTVAIRPSALVIGGGIAGIEAALVIADAGRKVYLVERDPAIGGHMAVFDKTFPTLDCAACILTPKTNEAGGHPNIELLTYSEVEDISGEVGNYKVRVRKKARYIDEEKCVGCGACWEACPQWRNPAAISKRKAGLKVFHHEATVGPMGACYIPTLQAVPKLPVIDRDACIHFKTGKCNKCVEACTVGAIQFDQEDSYVELNVGTIILATGYQPFDASRIPPLGWGTLPNVLTGLEFEVLCNAGGPTGGRVVCENGEPPKSVAVLHCVGSRDANYNVHCSRVCCMYSLKIAHLVREKTDAKVYECYIDMRAAGKGFEEFYHRVLADDVIMIRGKAASVVDVPRSPEEEGKLVVNVEDTLVGRKRRLPVDMVILSTGLEPAEGSARLGDMLGITTGLEGSFNEVDLKVGPIGTRAIGVFLAGCCQSPKDIPDSVAQAEGAAARALALMDEGEIMVAGEEIMRGEPSEEPCRNCGRVQGRGDENNVGPTTGDVRRRAPATWNAQPMIE